MYNFNPASKNEQYVFGAARPGYGFTKVNNNRLDEWIGYMKDEGITNICCLLSDDQLDFYDDLLVTYENYFGAENVCWAPVEDFSLVDESTLTQRILPFLDKACQVDQRVVVHCSAGQGRTGHVLAAWLVHGRSMSNEEAIKAVEAMGREPYEAEGRHEDGKRKLHQLLDACRLNAA